MRVYNYASFARVFEEGAAHPSMTSVAKILFEPVITLGNVLNRNHEPYYVNSKLACSWYKQEADIPRTLKDAVENKDVQYEIGKYFTDKVLEGYLSSVKTGDMLNHLIGLSKDSDLPEEQRRDLERCYTEGEPGNFLGKAFLYAILQDNRKKDQPEEPPSEATLDISSDLDAFNRVVRRFKKPSPISPPSTVADEEIKYVKELFGVYQEKTGAKCERAEDLEPYPRLKKHFNRQRKDYYLAETIRRGLRDTVCPDETQNFDCLKDEIYEGVVTTEEKEYDSGYDRLSAVMEHATLIQLSTNLNTLTLNWVGPGEKKGICHMLVNDDRLHWMEGD